MTLHGRLVLGRKAVYARDAEDGLGAGATFRDRLEACLVRFCKDADAPVPMWLEKNTREFARFGKTSFGRDQFAEDVPFDFFEIRVARR
jgi:hypothetical protein